MPLFVFSQSINKSINEIKVINKSLRLKINEFISNEKKCDYYSKDLVIYITINSINDGRLISLSSSNQIDLILNLSPEGVLIVENHYVFVGWDKSNDLIKYRKKNQQFQFNSQYNYILDEDGKMVIMINDDSFSQWDYLETDGTLLLKNKTSICE